MGSNPTPSAMPTFTSTTVHFYSHAATLRHMSTIESNQIAQLITAAIPDSQVSVHCFSGDDHFEVEVISPAFEDKSRVAQHQMVYAALGNHMRQAIHALALTTRIQPSQP
ncbi:MAG: BolA family protein [Mariprofundales bacterium]